MIWLALTIFTCILMHESKKYKSYELFTLICVIIQSAYTVYINYNEIGVIGSIVLFIVNGIIMDAINFYYGIGSKNKRSAI